MGLEGSLDALNGPNLAAIRTTGKRFQLATDPPRERLRCLRDALSVGGGYVELANDKNIVFGIIRWRHIDLNSPSPAVAPLSTSSASLSRAHAVGRCSCCEGSGSVPTVDEKLCIGRRTASPLDEGFLTPEALGVLRGVRRNTLVPFFKRMIAEGLWLQDRSFSRLGPEERANPDARVLVSSQPRQFPQNVKTQAGRRRFVASVGWLDSRDPRGIRKKQEAHCGVSRWRSRRNR